MKAMILAAGYGTRMGEVGKHIPKPLLSIRGKPLIAYHLEKLAAAGFTEVVINICQHTDKFKATLKDGSRYGIRIQYSEEPETPLGTGGGIYHALPLLGENPFLLISADVWTNYPLENLNRELAGLAHLVLVDNRPDHPGGDFYLKGNLVSREDGQRLTFGSIAVLHPKLFEHCSPGTFDITQPLNPAIDNQQVTGEHFTGRWVNINTPSLLSTL